MHGQANSSHTPAQPPLRPRASGETEDDLLGPLSELEDAVISYMAESRGASLHARWPMEHIVPDTNKCLTDPTYFPVAESVPEWGLEGCVRGWMGAGQSDRVAGALCSLESTTHSFIFTHITLMPFLSPPTFPPLTDTLHAGSSHATRSTRFFSAPTPTRSTIQT
jgi:hypothetical protein